MYHVHVALFGVLFLPQYVAATSAAIQAAISLEKGNDDTSHEQRAAGLTQVDWNQEVDACKVELVQTKYMLYRRDRVESEGNAHRAIEVSIRNFSTWIDQNRRRLIEFCMRSWHVTLTVLSDFFQVTRAQPVSTSGSDIWNKQIKWATLQLWHPEAVISNVNNFQVLWKDVAFLSWQWVLVFSVLVYPILPILILVIAAVLIATYIREDCASSTTTPSAEDLSLSNSAVAYKFWCVVCRLVPALLVFGVPVILISFAWSQPQEVFVCASLFTSVMFFLFTAYVAVHGSLELQRVQTCMGVDWSKASESRFLQPPERRVHHWVVIPQYQEDLETSSIALRSICLSTVANSMISVVLAMEEREDGAAEKAQHIIDRFGGQLCNVLVSMHPANLPNDPPGKASNVAWAFQILQDHVLRHEISTENLILTIADADSEFHQHYFECLTQEFLDMQWPQRQCCIWQSPIFHLRNYHRQPSLVAGGTMLFCMHELANLGDPHAARFPYSTYSLSYQLAHSVGGWDPEWIAEDYHMGMKCCLLAMGPFVIKPVHLPTVNYTPEDNTWWGTLMARFAQAKRHALGISDMTYYFMMLPLVFNRRMANPLTQRFRLMDSCTRFMKGFVLCMRLVTQHVMIGVISTYGVLTAGLKMAMQTRLRPDRQVSLLFEHLEPVTNALFVGSMICLVLNVCIFVKVYKRVQHRVEGQPWTWNILHFIYILICLVVAFPILIMLLVIAVWRAALLVIFTRTFHYEVALKPTRQWNDHAMDESGG